MVLGDVIDRFGEKKFDVEDLSRSLDEQGPYQCVFMQEMDVHNALLTEMVRSLNELKLGFAGELTMSDAMEGLQNALYLDRIPATWAKRAWPSKRGLASWLANFALRLNQIDEWQNNPMEIPKVTWLSGLVNPQSFLTAINQVAAQKYQWELDKLITVTDVLKKMTRRGDRLGLARRRVRQRPRHAGRALGPRRRERRQVQAQGDVLPMPVINVRGVSSDKAEIKGMYSCPTYKTEQRGPTYVFQAQLKTKSPPARWIMAGVALILDVA